MQLGMAMGIGPDPDPWIRIRFHGSRSLKMDPADLEDPFYFLYINFIKYIKFFNSNFSLPDPSTPSHQIEKNTQPRHSQFTNQVHLPPFYSHTNPNPQIPFLTLTATATAHGSSLLTGGLLIATAGSRHGLLSPPHRRPVHLRVINLNFDFFFL